MTAATRRAKQIILCMQDHLVFGEVCQILCEPRRAEVAANALHFISK